MLFLWLLLISPPAPACVLWIDHSPEVRDYYPPICPLDVMPSWDYYNLRLIGGEGQVLCEWPASQSLVDIPCGSSPHGNYHIEAWLNLPQWACTIRAASLDGEAVAAQCPDWLEAYQAGSLEVSGPYEIQPPAAIAPTCVLPQVENRSDLATHHRYEFLQGRLTWYGLGSIDDWQNQWDDNILGAADAASVPATILKSIMGLESRYWPAWTGDKGEVGLIQLTDAGADNAMRWSLDLFSRYCPLAILPSRCRSYDLLNAWERSRVRAALLADLTLQGWPTETAAKVKTDLWAYAHVLAATYCQAQSITGAPPTWDTVAAVYHAGGSCIQFDGSLCPEGVSYLEQMRQ